jgi:two-component system chemotaxis sensor kinase CheA
MSDSEAYQLIFAAGFSTKEQVTDISGRGVGMDVVKTNIHALQGTVQVETELGKGSTFRIRLPLTLAIIQGMIIRSGSERFVIPLSQVLESVRPTKDDITPSTIAGEVLSLRGQTIPLFRLDQLLGRRGAPKNAQDSIAVLYEVHGKTHAVLVDDIVGQHQVVIKKLGHEVAHVKAFSGSAILGDGKPALILELSELTGGTAKRPAPQRPIQEKTA